MDGIGLLFCDLSRIEFLDMIPGKRGKNEGKKNQVSTTNDYEKQNSGNLERVMDPYLQTYSTQSG